MNSNICQNDWFSVHSYTLDNKHTPCISLACWLILNKVVVSLCGDYNATVYWVSKSKIIRTRRLYWHKVDSILTTLSTIFLFLVYVIWRLWNTTVPLPTRAITVKPVILAALNFDGLVSLFNYFCALNFDILLAELSNTLK